MSESKKLIVIVGITGNQGASVADVFLKLPGWAIRGITRNTTSAKAQEWAAKGAEMVAADLNDVSSLQSAFSGAHVIFGCTDFLAGLWDPRSAETAKERGVNVNQIAYEIEVRQGRNIVDAAATCVGKGLERFVLSLLSGTKKWSKGSITENLHFDGKWEAVEYLKEKYPELDGKTSLLQVALYMQNWEQGGALAPSKQEDGSYVLRFPMRGDVKAPFVEPRADVGNFVKMLVDVEPGKNLLGVASWVSWNEWMDLFGKRVGVKNVKYEEMSVAEMAEMIPGGFGKELADMYQYIDRFGYDGGDPSVLTPEQLGVEVPPLMTIEKYMEKTDFSPIMG